jgi:hypothetical protein
VTADNVLAQHLLDHFVAAQGGVRIGGTFHYSQSFSRRWRASGRLIADRGGRRNIDHFSFLRTIAIFSREILSRQQKMRGKQEGKSGSNFRHRRG